MVFYGLIRRSSFYRWIYIQRLRFTRVPLPARRQLPHKDRQMPRERGTRRVVSRRWRACPSLKVPAGAEARSKGGTARPGREPPFRHRPPARHHGSCGGGTSLSFLLRPLQPPPRLAAAQVPFPASLACVLISVALPYAR
jgi:hypothetical protein